MGFFSDRKADSRLQSQLTEDLSALRDWARNADNWTLVPDPLGDTPCAAMHDTSYGCSLFVRVADDGVNQSLRMVDDSSGLLATYQVVCGDPTAEEPNGWTVGWIRKRSDPSDPSRPRSNLDLLNEFAEEVAKMDMGVTPALPGKYSWHEELLRLVQGDWRALG
jgi:hypothetical protein